MTGKTTQPNQAANKKEKIEKKICWFKQKVEK